MILIALGLFNFLLFNLAKPVASLYFVANVSNDSDDF